MLSERDKAQIEAAKAEGRIDGVRHLLDVVVLLITSTEERSRVTNAGHELLRIYEAQRQTQIDRFIAAARGSFGRVAVAELERAK